MGDNRRAICGCLFWTKAFLAFCLVCAILGFQLYQIYTMRSTALAKQAEKEAFERLVGGKDEDHDLKIQINPTNENCAIETVAMTNVTGSALTGLRHVTTTGNRLEPTANTRWFGFAIDFSYDTPTRLMARLGGRAPPVIAAFLTIRADFLVDENMVNWFGQETGFIGGILELTIVPDVLMDALPQSFYDSLTDILYRVNTRFGVPVLLRYGHEMNGNWSPYGQRPTAYKKSWITLTNLLRQKTNMTAMMWGPNPGSGYPYGIVDATNPDFNVLDTNGDGVITNTDDPYGPYWPGEQYVDWVAMSLYNYGFNVTSRQFDPISATYIIEQISGPWVGVQQTPYQDFYTRFVDQYAKPMAFPESGSPFIPGTPGDEVANKRAWWSETFRIMMDSTLYPNLKLAVQFEHIKIEEAIAGYSPLKDFSITNTTAMTTAFVTDLQTVERASNPTSGQFVWANALNYTCGGKIIVAK